MQSLPLILSVWDTEVWLPFLQPPKDSWIHQLSPPQPLLLQTEKTSFSYVVFTFGTHALRTEVIIFTYFLLNNWRAFKMTFFFSLDLVTSLTSFVPEAKAHPHRVKSILVALCLSKSEMWPAGEMKRPFSVITHVLPLTLSVKRLEVNGQKSKAPRASFFSPSFPSFYKPSKMTIAFSPAPCSPAQEVCCLAMKS